MIILPNNAEWHNELGMNNSEDAVQWVSENLLQNEIEELKTFETVERKGLQPLTRLKTITCKNGGYTLVLTLTYPSEMDCAGVTATYNLAKDE